MWNGFLWCPPLLACQPHIVQYSSSDVQTYDSGWVITAGGWTRGYPSQSAISPYQHTLLVSTLLSIPNSQGELWLWDIISNVWEPTWGLFHAKIQYNYNHLVSIHLNEWAKKKKKHISRGKLLYAFVLAHSNMYLFHVAIRFFVWWLRLLVGSSKGTNITKAKSFVKAHA